MRKRYIVSIVMAMLLAVLVGCTRNPDAAKRKYVESGMKYMDEKKYDSAIIQFKKALQVDPRWAEAHYQLGEAELTQQHWAAAFKEFSVAIDQDPNHVKAHLAIGTMWWQARKYTEAEEHARFVVEHDPTSVDGYMLLGNILLGQKKAQEAIDMYTKAAAIKPNDPGAYLNRGVAYASLKQDGAAEEDLRKAITVDPKSMPPYYALANFYMAKGDPKKSEEVLRSAIQNASANDPAPYLRLAGLMLRQGHKAEGEQVVQQLREKQASSALVAAAIGDYYLASRDSQNAIREYQRGLNLDPKNTDLQLRLLETMISSGQIDDATKLTDRLLKENPGDIMARITHARLLAIKGNTTEAITTLREVIKDAPENPQAHFVLGKVLHQTGDLAGAKSELQETLKRQPENQMALYALAETYRDSRDYDTAREYAARMQKLNDNPSVHFLNATIDIGARDYPAALTELNEVQKSVTTDPLLYLNYAIVYAGQKKYAEAEREFQTALKIYPQYDAAMGDYVGMMFATNNPAKAVALAAQYAAANPNRTQAHFLYGSALATTKKFDQAIEEFQKVIQIDPSALMAYIHIGQIYELTNRPDDALNAYQKALQIQPKSPLANNYLGNLYVRRGDLKNAGKYFQTALNENAHDPVAANNLAWVYASEGENLDMALSLATQAKQIAPNLEGINDTLAWIQYKKGNYHVSVTLAEDAVKSRPEKADYRYHLGMALMGAGEPVRAKAELQKALLLNLKGADAEQAQKTLASLH
jgi:tetratricopeptide (TPR) repeat protein